MVGRRKPAHARSPGRLERGGGCSGRTHGPGSASIRRAPLEGDEPVMAPDGHKVAYMHKGSIWLLNLISGSVRRALRSWLSAPKGSNRVRSLQMARNSPGRLPLLAGMAARCRRPSQRPLTLLAREASEPVYSPDGSEVAFIRWKNWRASAVDDGSPPIDELRVTRVGAFPRSRLLQRKPTSCSSSPSWDPSGQRLAFIRTRVVNGYTPRRKAMRSWRSTPTAPPEEGLLRPGNHALRRYLATGSRARSRPDLLREPLF